MLTWIQLLPTGVAMPVLAIIAMTSYGIVALWAVGGSAKWLARVAPVAFLLAALVPIGAYELLAVFGAQIAVMILCGLLVRCGRGYRVYRNRGASRRDAMRFAARLQGAGRARFRLQDVLYAVLLAGAVSAIVRFAPPMQGGAWANVGWGEYALVGAVFGLTTIAAGWTVFGDGRWYVRFGLTIIIFAMLCAAVYWGSGVNLMSMIAVGGVMASVMALARSAGWVLWQLPVSELRPVAQTASGSRSWTRRLSQALFAAAALAAITALAPVYLELLPAAPADLQPVPSPNGYDELVQLGQAVNWSALPSQDVEEADTAARAQFVRDNANTLAHAHRALTDPSAVPIAKNPALMANDVADVQILRSLARALAMEAQLAQSESRYADAVAVYLDLIDLGDASSNGGLLIHELVGIAIKSIGLHGIESSMEQLEPAGLVALRQRLDSSIAEQEPIEQVFQRDRAFAVHQNGWMIRVILAVDDSLIRPAYDAATGARRRSGAHLRLILAEAALRQYVLQHGAPPESLAALVPEYLSKVPHDPFGDAPLVYRKTDDGYVLYSVGSNGIDGGGQRVPFDGAATFRNGDLFLNVPEETPEESDVE